MEIRRFESIDYKISEDHATLEIAYGSSRATFTYENAVFTIEDAVKYISGLLPVFGFGSSWYIVGVTNSQVVLDQFTGAAK